MNLHWTPQAAQFVAQFLGFSQGFGANQSAFVIDKNGQVAAGIVFHNWNPDAGVIEVSAAALSPKWAQRRVLRDLTGYAWAIGCQAMVARHSEDNAPARRLWAALGATEHFLPHMRGRNVTECVAILTKDAFEASKFAR